jgi:hypothetical protein
MRPYETTAKRLPGPKLGWTQPGEVNTALLEFLAS